MDTFQEQDVSTGVNGSKSILPLLESGKEITSENSPKSLETGRDLYTMGKLYYDKADIAGAKKYFDLALESFVNTQDFSITLKILGFLVRIASEQLDQDQADRYIAKTKNMMDDLTTRLEVFDAEYFYNAGIVKNYYGNFNEAGELYQAAYKRCNEESNQALASKCLLSLVINSYYKDEYQTALDYALELKKLLEVTKKFYLAGSMYFYMAKIYTKLDLSKKALECYSMSNQILNSKKCWNLQGYIFLGQGIIHKGMGNYKEALLLFDLAEQYTDKNAFKRLSDLLSGETQDTRDASVDIYLNWDRRTISERTVGTIDFKHRFVLLEILFLLAKNQGTYFDKEKLASYIWKDEYNPLIHDKLIYTSISRLRKLIEPSKIKHRKHKYIVRGKDGYMFNPMKKICFYSDSSVYRDRSIGNVGLSSPV